MYLCVHVVIKTTKKNNRQTFNINLSLASERAKQNSMEPDKKLSLFLEKYNQTRNTRYLGQLFAEASRLVFGVCMYYLNNRTKDEDAAQEVYIKFQNFMEKTDDDFQINKIESFIRTITIRYCIDLLRKEKQQREIHVVPSGEYFEHLLFVELSPSERLFYEDERDIDFIDQGIEQLKLCLEKLKAEQRTGIDLFYLRNLDYKQVAEHMSCTFKQVKSYIQNGKRNLGICINSKLKR